VLRRREWQGEYVLYNDLSGDTHLLGAGAIDLLLALQQSPSAESALGDAAEADPADDPDAPSLLAQLQALSLIEPVA
jgi:PqqD family protein of HPr-rel-A system